MRKQESQQKEIIRKLIAVILILVGSHAFADANDGDYLGYRLGDTFTAPKGDDGRMHITGPLIFDVDPGLSPHHVDRVSVFVSPKSSVIGSILGEWYFASHAEAERFANRYLAALERKYEYWKLKGRSLTLGDHQLWVDIEGKTPIDDEWPSLLNHRVGIGLIYTQGSLRRDDWMATVFVEANEVKVADSR